MAEPVIDVSSVTVSPRCLPCAVYGNISAYDKLDLNLPIYELYKRDAEHAELILATEQELSVIDLDKVLFMQQPVISIKLKLKDNDALFANGVVDLDITTDNDYEQVKQSVIKGDFGHTTVNYIALSRALLFKIGVLRKGQDSDSDFPMFGSIVANYGKTVGCTDHFRIPLLTVPSNESIAVIYGDYWLPTIKLSRNLVAVPAYSSLIIKTNLSQTTSDRPLVNDENLLWPYNRRAISKFEDDNAIVGEKNMIEVFALCFELSELKPSSRHTLTEPLRKLVEWGGFILLEVFSVFIGRENDEDLNVYGTITLEKMCEPQYDIFKRDANNPYRLLNGRKLLPMTCPRILDFLSPSVKFGIRVNLKDASHPFFIEEGIVVFDTLLDDNFELEFNRPLCSVIRGGFGHCAVHYAIFGVAAKVELKFVLLCRGVDVAEVSGKIVAGSDIFDYRTDYDKKYYRRVLYDEPDGITYSPQNLAPKKTDEQAGEVMLSECIVAVPFDFSYNIDVDLYASSPTSSSPAECLHQTLSFRIEEDQQMEMKISGGNFDLHIKIFIHDADEPV